MTNDHIFIKFPTENTIAFLKTDGDKMNVFLVKII